MDSYRTFRRKQGFLYRNFTFSGYLTASQFWSELGIRIIELLCGAILICILISIVVPGTTEDVLSVTNVAVPIFAVLWLIPMIAMTRRRLRDAGYTAKSYLWLLLPVIGWLVFILRLCAKTKLREEDKPSYHY